MNSETRLIYFDKKTEKYYYDGDSVCDDCGTNFNELFFEYQRENINSYRGNNKVLNFSSIFLCRQCVLKLKDNADVKSICMIIKRKPPQTAFPIMTTKPIGLVDSSNNETVFTMADKADGSQVIDKTVIAGRESLAGASIGLSPQQAIEHKDNVLPDPFGFLDDLQKAKPILKYDSPLKLDSSPDTHTSVGSNVSIENKDLSPPANNTVSSFNANNEPTKKKGEKQ